MILSDFCFVLLDIDNTLYPYEPAHLAGQASVSDHLVAVLGEEITRVNAALEAGRADTGLRLHGTAASHHRLLYFQAALEQLGRCPMPLALDCHDIYWDRFLDTMEPFADTRRFLSRLDPSRTCFVTDLVADIQYKKIRRLGLQDFVHHLVTSEEAGAEKPDPAIFLRALGKLGAVGEQSCMIGDSFEKDIVGAARLGMGAFWLNPHRRSPPAGAPFHRSIQTLEECHE
jgi:FMN phosphatase YigB (HAD superfamily)